MLRIPGRARVRYAERHFRARTIRGALDLRPSFLQWMVDGQRTIDMLMPDIQVQRETRPSE